MGLELTKHASHSPYFLSMSFFMFFHVIFPRANFFIPSTPICLACNSSRTSCLAPLGTTTSSLFFTTSFEPLVKVHTPKYCFSLPILNNSLVCPTLLEVFHLEYVLSSFGTHCHPL